MLLTCDGRIVPVRRRLTYSLCENYGGCLNQLEQTEQGCRTCTLSTREKAVERVIIAMRERLAVRKSMAEPFSLQEMADLAVSSPYHFNRGGRRITGLPPCQFLSTMRLEAAKRLLLTTQLNVIDICYAVGYESLGTFTTRFTQLVGLPPTSFRRMAEELNLADISHQYGKSLNNPRATLGNAGLKGRVSGPKNFDGLIFVGLFPLSIPQAEPASCALLSRPGAYRLESVLDGHYSIMVTAIDKPLDPFASVLTENALRGKAGHLVVLDGHFVGSADIVLRQAHLTDPPIIIALPYLLTQRLAVPASIAI
jgi:AraC family transcriptional regulator